MVDRVLKETREIQETLCLIQVGLQYISGIILYYNVLWFLRSQSFTNAAYIGTFFAGPPGPPGPTGPKGATGESYLELDFC